MKTISENIEEFMDICKPIIAVLGGTGKEGPGLAMRWARAGYQVIIGSRQKDKAENTAQRLNDSLGIETIRGMENSAAAKSADISVLTVVQSAHQSAIESLKDVLQGKILVDATARVDFRKPTPPPPPAAAEIAQSILGDGVKVVAAFQNVPAHSLRNLDEDISSEVMVCGDDIEAAMMVVSLAETGGMRAYYAGPLYNANTIEGLTAILISLNKYYKVKTASIGITGI